MKRKRDTESTRGSWSPKESDYKRTKRYDKSSPSRYSPRDQRVVPGGRSRSNTADLEVILQQLSELRFIIENMGDKLTVLQYQLKNIERFVDNRKPVEQEKSSQLCSLM